jgi:8-oxo-dGTP diphosphatase
MLYHVDDAGETRVLLQHRALWGIGGGTWGLLGGARHSHEDAVTGALREAAEESTLDPAVVRVHGVIGEDHGGWCYDSVVASVVERPEVEKASMETRDVRWVPAEEVASMKLFEPFAVSWQRLRFALKRTVLVVDAANVVGARADGWWRDRAGATTRLRDELANIARTGIAGIPDSAFDVSFPEIVLVVEGAARGVDAGDSGIRVVAAPGSGDDKIVGVVKARDPDETCLVVTADRALRERCRRAGASVTGPKRLVDLLNR